MAGLKGEVALLVNPTSGRGRGASLVTPVAERLQARGLGVRLVVGDDADDALALTHKAVADGAQALVALGGDGLVHLALQAVAGSDVPLGVVPGGTGNDLAHDLGVPAAWQDAVDVVARAVLAGSARTVDAVRSEPVGGGAVAWWAAVLGAGFDSAVTERANRMRWPTGPRKYDLAIVAELAAFRPVPFRLELDGPDGPAVHELEAMFVAVGNGSRYGAGMRICPGARLDDGLLDVTVVGPLGRVELVRMFPTVYKGTHVAHRAVSTYRAASVVLSSPGQVAYADGERLGPLPVASRVVPGALRVLG